MNSCNFIKKAISHTLEVEILTRPILCHFGRYVVRAKLFCLKCFISRSPGWSVHMRKFHPGYRDLGRKNRDLGNLSGFSLSYEHIDIFTKKRVACNFSKRTVVQGCDECTSFQLFFPPIFLTVRRLPLLFIETMFSILNNTKKYFS